MGRNYHGVTKASGRSGYQAQIRVSQETVVIWPLRLATAEEAARVADIMAIYLKGSGVGLNFEGRPPPSLTRAEIKRYLKDRGVLPNRCLDEEPAVFSRLETEVI